MSIGAILDNYKKNYVKIFNLLYPAKNNTGFTERNLSVNFAKSYENANPEAITWYEFQFGEKNNLHYDAIIVNPIKKEVLLIESKRFSNPKKKIQEISSDIERINHSVSLYHNDFSSRIKNFDDYSVHGVILADVWTETKLKRKIKESFITASFLKDFLPELNETKSSWFFSGTFYCQDFSNISEFQSIKQNYNLLSMIWTVKKV